MLLETFFLVTNNKPVKWIIVSQWEYIVSLIGIVVLQHVTYHMIRTMIFTLWGFVVLLVSTPLFGFGIYFDPGPPQKCLRYRQATDPVGIAYAYVYFTFGKYNISLSNGKFWHENVYVSKLKIIIHKTSHIKNFWLLSFLQICLSMI